MSERDEEDKERERPSWREIDQRKDRSSHIARDPSAPRKKTAKAEWLRKRALKEADKFFSGKQGTLGHDRAVRTLHSLFGTRKFNSQAKKYLEEYSLPKDWGTQFLFLDYSDPEVVIALLNQMAKAYPERSLREQQAFLSKLRTLKIMAEEGEVQEVAAEVLASF